MRFPTRWNGERQNVPSFRDRPDDAYCLGQTKIRIILLSYIEGDSENLGLFYDSFAQLVSNREYTAMLAEKPTYECLTDIAAADKPGVKSINTYVNMHVSNIKTKANKHKESVYEEVL